MTRLGKYEIIEEIGRGSFAIVYSARDIELNRLIALKILRPQFTTDSKFIECFRREAHTAASLNHPHITTIYEVGELNGQFYIAMELAQGQSLAQYIQQRKQLTEEETLRILTEVASALDYAHSQGLVHRDIKPSNILIDPNKGALLSDFGLAKMIEATLGSLTNNSGIAGTFAYIAPEIWAGEKPTAASDVYALGCVFYEMITGDVLFDSGSLFAVIKQHEMGPQLKLNTSNIGKNFRDVLLAALKKSPSDRYQRAGLFVAALRDVWEKSKITQEKASHRKPLVQSIQTLLQKTVNKPLWIITGVLIALLLSVGGKVWGMIDTGQIFQTFFTSTPTTTFTATPTQNLRPTLTVTTAPFQTSTPTTTNTILSTETPRPTLSLTNTPIPNPISPILVTPQQGLTYQSPITFQWNGQLYGDQKYLVQATNTRTGYQISSSPTASDAWTVELPGETFGEWKWRVYVTEGTNTVTQSTDGYFWFDPFPSGSTNRGISPITTP